MLLVDVINEFAFPEAHALLRRALPMARALQRLKQRVNGAGVSIVYINDNFGRSNRTTWALALRDESGARPAGPRSSSRR